mgnify:CR=1 FL=1
MHTIIELFNHTIAWWKSVHAILSMLGEKLRPEKLVAFAAQNSHAITVPRVKRQRRLYPMRETHHGVGGEHAVISMA